MKLNNKDKALLEAWGYEPDSLAQIERATWKKSTTLTCGGKEISAERAIQILGREVYLSGIARSAFHYTAARQAADGSMVYFDSYRMHE